MRVSELTQNSLRDFVSRLREGQSLKARAARGSLYLGVGSIGEYGLRFVRQMILTRLIAPEAFGTMAIVLAVSGIFEAVTEVGIREAIIQSPKGAERKYMNGAWFFAFGRGCVLFAIGYLAMPWVADFYADPSFGDFLPMLRFAFLAVLLNGAISTRAYVAQKQMKYGRWALLFHGGAVIGILTTIVLGFVLQNVWALVIGFIVESAARCLLSYALCPFLPRLDFDKDSIKALLRYSAGMAGLPLLTFLFNKGDTFVIGKVMTMADLGPYYVAYGLAYMPNLLYGSVLVPLIMPAFSAIQGDREAVARNFLRMSRYVALAVMPGFALVACIGRPLLSLLYGEEYGAVAVPFAILCATVASRMLSRGFITVFFSTGLPGVARRADIIRLITLAVIVVPLTTRYGLSGAASASLAASLTGDTFNMFKMGKLHGATPGQFLSAISGGLAAGAAVVALWWVGTLVF